MNKQAASGTGVGAGYLLVAAVAGLLGGGASVLRQAGLMPDQGVWPVLEHIHAPLMLLFVVIPALVCGFSNLWLPRALGRAGMVLPALNGAGLGLVGVSGVLAVVNGAPAPAPAILLWCVGLLCAVMTVLATIFDSRADTEQKLPFSPFVWGEMLASSVLLLTVPVLAAVMTHQLLSGAQTDILPLLDGFAEPVTLVTLLAGFGLVFETGARASRFSEKPVIAIMTATAAASVIIWTRGVFAHGLAASVEQPGTLTSPENAVLFASTLASVLLAGLWMAGTWRSRLSLRVPMLWGLGFLAVVSTGWVAQLIQGDGLHSALQLGAVYAAFCGLYLWRGENGGYWYPRSLAVLQFVLMAAATGLSFSPLSAAAQIWSGGLLGVSLLCFVATMGMSFMQNRKVPEGSEASAQPVLGASSEGTVQS
ncbi:cbb3-type cytochrome c oxidase subunit I [Acetobacter cerevisiae]|uniref:Cbb3-type cytochrome c oxidase subunit I n=1 Tax=Acetobacter cerevisiae TaxID=178900 RepID=A0ABT1ER27_9PROT|nr:cbb3-type cytochrome c oxidase subunit I [Acetobacter cerevisiae]MCP1245637.1 cbb3-type cytochrome c oxidase subunit I [Acetobacter cerevisiae]MCP1255217.1 cbb3-type cytochrome c oxidase subunit I [Acetobacter cerevisiae]